MEKGYDKVDGASHDADMQKVNVYRISYLVYRHKGILALEGFTGPKRICIYGLSCVLPKVSTDKHTF